MKNNLAYKVIKKNINQSNIRNNNYIDYEESTSLEEIFNTFIKEYLNFINEYKNIDKLKDYEELTCYGLFSTPERKYIAFDFLNNNKLKESKNGYLLLELEQKGNNYKAYITNDNYLNLKTIYLDINEESIKHYIELFTKYKDLFNAYEYLKSGLEFNNGINYLTIDIIGSLIKGIESIKINYIDTKNKSCDEIIISPEENPKNENNELSYNLLKNIYINNNYLPNLFQKNNNKKKVKK